MVEGRCTNWYEPLAADTAEGRVNGACRGRGEATPQGDDLVGRLRRRTGEPGLPDRGAGCLDRRARHHGRVRPVDDLGSPRRAARTTSTPRWRRCSRTRPAASRCTRTRLGASTSPSSARSPPSATGSRGRACSRSTATSSARWSQAEWFEDTTFTQDVGDFQWNLPVWIGIGCIVAVWLFNIYGVRPAVWLSYVTGGLLILPAATLMFLPYLTGDWSSDNMTWEIGAGGGLGLAITWLYFMGWSAYGFETVAAFAPEYHNPEFDTPRALRASAAFSVVVYALLPLGVGGTLGTAAIADDATGDRVLHGAHSTMLVGTTLGGRPDRLPDRRPAAVDEHGHDGRLAGALRDRAGRDDDEVAGPAQPLQRARDRHDDGRDPQPVPDLLLRLPARHPGRGQPRLHAGARVRAHRVPAAAQGPAGLAAADQAGGRWVPIAALLAAINLAFIVVGGFI